MLDWLSTKLDNILAWCKALYVAVFGALGDMLVDLAIKVLDLFLVAVAGLVAAIPVPGFLTSGLQSLVSGLPDVVLWAMGALGLPQCLALLGSGVVFRLTRKLFTLGQW
jgi:hypothetical protein